jgi:UrcA family protein
MLRSPIIASVLVTLALFGSPVRAQEVRTASVVINEADFSTAVARADLDRRIAAAAQDVCGSNAAAENSSWGQVKACRAEVRAQMLASARQHLKMVRLSSR